VGKAETLAQDLEAKKESLLMEMADPAVATHAGKLGDLVGQVKKLEREISETIREWERLTLRLEAYLDRPK